MTTWLKVPKAAKENAGGVSPKVLYAAIRQGKLKAARIGSGRNILVCEAFIDEWLMRSAGEPVEETPPSIRRVG
jgi:hypothetical protein